MNTTTAPTTTATGKASRSRATRPADRTPNKRRTAPGTPPPAAADTQPALPPAEAGANSSEDRVAAVLTTGPDLTVAVIAEAASLGRSTVAKALLRLETAGRAVRSPGSGAGRTREPDRWNPTPPTTRARTTRARTTTRQAHTTTTGGTGGTGSGNGAGAASGRGPATQGRTKGAATSTAQTVRNPKTNTTRLAPGELTALVAGHFAAHPGVPLTAGEVGRALGRSGGAVRNAADKLTTQGALQLLAGPIRRYTTTAT
jgi:hypothetical protein